MWNNGNGNGNGYGQNPNDVYDRLNNARQISNRDPYIEEGTHTLAVITLEEFPSDQGQAVRGSFEVLESSTMRPGTKVGAVWFLQKPAPKQGMVTDSDRFADFCCRLKGAPQGYAIGNDIRVLLRDRGAEQLARGMIIRAVGVKKIAKTTGKAFVVVHWGHLEQTPQQIAEMRQRIEAKGLVEPPRGNAGQFQGAPHPSQMQGQYPAQQGPYMPQQPPPQHATPLGYQGPPVGGYGPQGNAYPAQPQQPQGVPPGGFLANVPPQGQGGNGGGQGGGQPW